MRQSDLPPVTSATQLSTYASCPRRYELKYVLRVAPERRGTGLALGSAVHGAIEWWFEKARDGEEPSIDGTLRIARADLDAALAHEHIDWRGTTRETLGREAELLVRMFLEHHGALRVRETEVPFELPIVDQVTGERFPRPLVGYFDMELASGNVVELKTAKAAFSAVTLRVGLQFAAYRTAARYAGVDVELYALIRTKRPRVQHVVLPHAHDVSRWFMHAAARIERAIHAGHFPPAPGPCCASCDYRSTCMGDGADFAEVEDAEAA